MGSPEYCREWRKRHPKNTSSWRHRTGRCKPLEQNPASGPYLGDVTEKFLVGIFKNVERMPYGTHGYDFLIGHIRKIDAKGACRVKRGTCSDSWRFNIRCNGEADEFACVAFDNRQMLNIEHVWILSIYSRRSCFCLAVWPSETQYVFLPTV
jgi:hypothetical protein